MLFKKKNISSLHIPHNKNTAGLVPTRIDTPKEVVLPMNVTSHAMNASKPAVSVGDHVRVGQVVACEEGSFSTFIHAPISGTVTSIEPMKFRSEQEVLAITIESDGKMELSPDIKKPEFNTCDEFLQAVNNGGIVGLGGAAFPIWAKLREATNPDYNVDTVLINAAECEPYITSDHRIMLEEGNMLKAGIDLLHKYIGAERFVICIEDNKQDAIDNLTKIFEGDSCVEIQPLPSIYPQGAKQVLLYNVTGKVVKGGQRMASLGVLITNVSSVTKMAEYMTTGMPLVERIVTVDGTAVKEPKNVKAPIGTPISHIIEQAGGLKSEAFKVLIGGPMLGTAVSSLDQPIQKVANAVLFMTKKEAAQLEPSVCIRCGRCMANCPVNLNLEGIAAAMELEDEDKKYARLKDLGVGQCIECACCSYVCPAHKPIMQTNNESRKFMKKYQAAHAEEGRK
ncbi:MAG: electron transport complex subunit RsxC [Clostridia bacterium]|nr:electron transport complex subunit RsxC [Clostridia bacterium]